jgi:Ribosomal protein L23
MKTAYDVIIRPIITEQSMEDLDIKKYAFEVAKDANKVEIKKGHRGNLRCNRNQGYNS